MERGISPQERLKYQEKYSEAMSDGSRALVLRLKLTVSVNQGASKRCYAHSRREVMNFQLVEYFEAGMFSSTI